MRVLLLGGTRFIGHRIAAELMGRGDDVTVVHRGESEPAELGDCTHLHADRADLPRLPGRLRALRPDAVIDTRAMTKADAEAVLRGGTALRLAMTYGERDGQRREELILRRVRAGRRRIPVGAGHQPRHGRVARPAAGGSGVAVGERAGHG